MKYVVCKVCGGDPDDPQLLRPYFGMDPVVCGGEFHAGHAAGGFELTSEIEKARVRARRKERREQSQ